jgi:hypothetical protein
LIETGPTEGREEKTLFFDVLNLHMVRGYETSTIISYHPDSEWCMTSASGLQSRFRLVGESVYWQNIFKNSRDPTFLLLALFWHPVYAWDEALENLYSHILILVRSIISDLL